MLQSSRQALQVPLAELSVQEAAAHQHAQDFRTAEPRTGPTTLQDLDDMIWEATLLRWGVEPHLQACCRRYWWAAISGTDADECAVCLQKMCLEDTVADETQDLSLTLLSRCSHMLHTRCLANYLLAQGVQTSRTEARQSRARVGDCQQAVVEPKCPICRGDISSRNGAGWLRSAADKFTWAYLEGDLLPVCTEEMRRARARMASVLRFARALPCSPCMSPPVGHGSGSWADVHAVQKASWPSEFEVPEANNSESNPAETRRPPTRWQGVSRLWSARGFSLISEMLGFYSRSDASAHVLTNLLS